MDRESEERARSNAELLTFIHSGRPLKRATCSKEGKIAFRVARFESEVGTTRSVATFEYRVAKRSAASWRGVDIDG